MYLGLFAFSHTSLFSFYMVLYQQLLCRVDRKPSSNFFGVVGTSVGSRTDVSFDTKIGNFTKYNVGISFFNPNLIAAFTLVEVNNDFSSNENTLIIGSQHALDPLTTVKAWVNNFRKASALTQHALTLKQINNGVIVPPSGWKFAKLEYAVVSIYIYINYTTIIDAKSPLIGDTFVPNDVYIGGADHFRFIVLTGPNMGGKSTIMCQVCLALILAQLTLVSYGWMFQVGVDVPAQSFKMFLVDRIFVRIAAKDHIMAGHSTFLTELLETASMLVSLCVGFVSAMKLDMLCSHQQHVSLCYMACQVGDGDGGVEDVTFLYKLTIGACPKSCGLPDAVLKMVAIKSQEFETMYVVIWLQRGSLAVTSPLPGSVGSLLHSFKKMTRLLDILEMVFSSKDSTRDEQKDRIGWNRPEPDRNREPASAKV
uniref:DNA mismatch repair proteins mutS family domain-containing protein n=1 Tax=Lactuca sativa TaxID=4236 RepID=A0A9R1VXY7_LACSA|nr:hypothetical protein LSAT_V11C400224020 [Lactuca sativa]